MTSNLKCDQTETSATKQEFLSRDQVPSAGEVLSQQGCVLQKAQGPLCPSREPPSVQLEPVGHLFPKPHPVDRQLLNREVSPPQRLGNSSSTLFKFWHSYGAETFLPVLEIGTRRPEWARGPASSAI